ncbi:MAG: hypothetical protein Kow0099_05930 [Candidatus Abyssubacteria bacterium]
MTANRSHHGFTLLEVMVALAIIASALVTLLATHLMGLNLAQKHKEQTFASLLARQKMEEVLTMPYDSLLSDSGEYENYPGYQWELDVEDGEEENLKKVKITITFLPEGTFELQTMVARTIVE